MNSPTPDNQLAQESSLYLQQHASNPVHWRPWNEQALSEARQQDKPILLSIGYSACHWCHVMAHESFEDPDTASVMNELYINIKVDREERPDLDKIYQTAHQLLNQRPGGWPLTLILSPDTLSPFFAGTYFPVSPRHGMPAFKEILKHAEEFYRTHRHDIEQQNQGLQNALQQIQPSASDNRPITALPLDQARHELASQFDKQHGGFGQAPKFPHPTSLERCLRHDFMTRRNNNPDSLAMEMLNTTLYAMANGGLFDQLGGGFFRYSVDDTWTIPHFEKMLYDNGPLLALYAESYAACGDVRFKQIAMETAQWAIREMQSPQGGFYSTLDADSEGEEGKFYVWDRREIETLLNKDEYVTAKPLFGLDQTPNFEGHWHLTISQPLDEDNADSIAAIKQKLFQHREQRIKPGRDEKIITAWNGLMIKGLCIAGRRLHDEAQKETFTVAAQKAVDFIRDEMIVDNHLMATHQAGQPRYHAYLDDYAFVLDAVLESLQSNWRNRDLELAMFLADALLERFEDKQHGGFYFTENDHEQLLYRPKTLTDEAIPSGAAIACYALNRIGHLLGETRYIESSQHCLQNAWHSIEQYTHAHGTFLNCIEEHLNPVEIVILRGNRENLHQWQYFADLVYHPRRMVFAISDTETDLPALLNDKKAVGEIVAYRCEGMTCHEPITDIKQYKEMLG